MSSLSRLQFRLSRGLGRLVTRVAATLTYGTMPPFVSTSAVIVRDGAILVVVDSIIDEPVLPGGHLKWREHPTAAAVREVREETGYLIEPGELLGVFTGRDWAGEEGVVRIVYDARVVGGELASSSEGEARWMSVPELADSSTRDAALLRIWLQRRAEPAV